MSAHWCPVSGAASARSRTSSPDYRAILYRLNDNTSLYGIFDIHNGSDAAHIDIQKIVDEILQAQLNENHSDQEIKDILSNAFLSVEKSYTKSISSLVKERTALNNQLPNDLDQIKVSFNKLHANILDKLKQIDEQLSIGITSVIALVHNEKLFVANIGNSRALLCKTDDNCVLRVVQLSVDHSLNNEDELLRLSQLDLNIDKLRKAEQLGNQCSTRCLGNYLVKNFYKNFPDLINATNEPVISIPEVHGPISLDESCRFLVLMSDELFKNLQESSETEQVNKQFAQIIVEQFRIQSNMEAVCQAVVDKTMRIYHEHCITTSKAPWRNSRNTLLIRNFNFPLPNDPSEGRVRFNPIIQSRSPTMTNEESDFDRYTTESSEVQDLSSITNTNSNRDDSESQYDENLDSTMTLQFSQNSDFPSNALSTYTNSRMRDKNKKIQAYVDFSQYYQNFEKAKINGSLPAFMKFD